MATKTNLIAKAGIGIVALGIAVGAIGSASAATTVTRIDAGGFGGAARATTMRYAKLTPATPTRRHARGGRFQVGFTAE